MTIMTIQNSKPQTMTGSTLANEVSVAENMVEIEVDQIANVVDPANTKKGLMRSFWVR
jgi:hypothetical protein